MFSHIIIFGSSLPELLGGHSLCAIICGRVLMSHTHRCHSPLLITMTEFPRRSKATCPPAESKDGGSGSADAVWCGVVWCGVVWCGVASALRTFASFVRLWEVESGQKKDAGRQVPESRTLRSHAVAFGCLLRDYACCNRKPPR
jgi:hypothetical protein